ncbi:MAG: PEP-CTERM sorting domain-containing protein [Verrucomicrobiales bacterium]
MSIATSLKAGSCLAAYFLAPAVSASIVSIPFVEDFESYATDGPTDFTESNSAAFQIQSYNGSQTYRAAIVSSASAWASVQAENSAGKDFSISSDFIFNSVTQGSASAANLSLIAAATDGNFSNSGGAFYRVSMNYFNGNNFTLIRSGTALTPVSSSGVNPSLVGSTTGDLYEISLDADYLSATSANLTLTIVSDAGTYVANYVDNSTISGEFFVYRVAKNGSGSAISIYTDNFSLNVVPEPSGSLLFLVSGTLLGRCRRRVTC